MFCHTSFCDTTVLAERYDVQDAALSERRLLERPVFDDGDVVFLRAERELVGGRGRILC
jgi:hypothetical protein